MAAPLAACSELSVCTSYLLSARNGALGTPFEASATGSERSRIGSCHYWHCQLKFYLSHTYGSV